MEKEMTPNEKRPQQDCGGMFTQVQASVEILSPVPVSGKCSEKDYERLFIRDPEVKEQEQEPEVAADRYRQQNVCHADCVIHILPFLVRILNCNFGHKGSLSHLRTG